jgi:hypothetical protein
MLIQMMENMIKQQTKIRLMNIEWKGNRYTRTHPRTDAYVPGAKGR